MKMLKRLLVMILTVCMIIGLVTDATIVNALESRAATTTVDQPFASGTGGSDLFRIPAMITTKNGTIVAAADARWNHKGDAGGIETIVSYSEDNGKNWVYTFANYLGDNNKTHNTACATFIDPVLTYDESNNTIYMIVDLYVGGYAINTAPTPPEKGSAFNDEGHLRIKKSGESDYNYHVEGNKIYSNEGTLDSEFTVDGYFNLRDANGDVVGNLFYSNSAYQAYPTTYLYMTKSTDDGKTWSTPTLIDGVKKDEEYFYGTGPGRGIVTKDGTLVVPCYVFAGTANQRSSFIYSTDNGKSWTRSPDVPSSSTWSSESQLVQLSDGTIRCFFRNNLKQVCYVDAKGNPESGYTWGNVVNTGLYSCSNTQMSAITYSKKIDGKDAIIISYPASANADGDNEWNRVNGRIVVGLINDDSNKTMDWKYTYHVNETHYWYSCLTELDNGNIALLYETNSEGTQIVYETYNIDDLVEGAVVDGVKVVKVGVNETITFTDATGDYSNATLE